MHQKINYFILNLDPQKLFSICAIFLILTIAQLIEIRTLLLLSFSAFFFYMFMKQKISKIRKNGILSHFSQSTQNLLLNRSIFDILCDLWYFPVITKYFRAIFGPFIRNIEPEESKAQFSKLHPSF